MKELLLATYLDRLCEIYDKQRLTHMQLSASLELKKFHFIVAGVSVLITLQPFSPDNEAHKSQNVDDEH